ncbi:MAG: DUF3857 domain-containing protein, partial [Planctomycetota bacterium]
LALDYRAILLLNLSRLYMKRGQTAQALELAEKTVREFPQNRASYQRLAAYRQATGDLAGATQAWTAWLEICPEDGKAYLALADIAASQSKERQVAHLEKATALNPNLKEALRKLEYLKADTKRFYAGFEMDSALERSRDPGPDPNSEKKGDSHYYVFRHALTRAYRDGTTSRYEHFLARVLNEEGANFFDTYQPPFNRMGQTARILEARVLHADGTSERARLGRAYWVDLPPIKVGDWVEISARVDDRSRSFFGDYFGMEHLFPALEMVPVHKSRLDLILEPGREYHFQSVGDVPEPEVTRLPDGSEHRRYELVGLKRREIEESSPGPWESGPLLRVSTYGTWDEFASWWWNLIRKQTVATPQIKAKVRELTANVPDLASKVRRIYEFVATDIRYKAWEFGVHGYKPYSVGAIFARRHGDCKDKAILMNSMLQEIGVQGYPVLIKADERREKDDLTLPLVEHFNHCITYLPAQEGLRQMFLDGTAEYHPLDTLPSMDAGATVLSVHGEHAEVLKIPWTRPEENRDERVYRVAIRPNGAATVEMTHRPHRQHGPSVRARYGNEEGKRRERLADRLGSSFGRVDILDMRFSDLSDLSQDVEYSVKFEVKNLLARQEEEFRVKSAFRPENLSRLATAETRVHDMLLRTPESREVTIIYEAPEGFSWGSVPSNVDHESNVGSFHIHYRREGNKLVIHRVRSLKSQRVTSELYPEFRKLTRIVDRSEQRELKLRKAR